MGISDRLKRWFVEKLADYDLMLATFYNNPHMVSASLAQGANPQMRNLIGQTLLFLAADGSRDPAIAEQLLARGADPIVRDRFGRTPLHVAAAFGTEAHLRVLLDGGAAIDAYDREGVTPLHVACGFGRFDQATFLVSRGAHVALRDQYDLTPLDHLRERHQELLGKEPWERLLGGFLTARVLEVQGNSLRVQVESLHWKYTKVEQQARERGTLILPCGYLDDVPEPGDILRCAKGLAHGQEKIWRATHRRGRDIERER